MKFKVLRYLGILFFMFTFQMSGQGRTVDEKFSRRYSRLFEQGDKLGLDSLLTTKSNWHFRIWIGAQVIDLWEDFSGKRFGKLTWWTKENTPRGEYPTNRYLFESSSIDSLVVVQLTESLISSKMASLSDGLLMEGGLAVPDGKSYVIEQSTKHDYFVKSYGVFSSNSEVKIQMIIESFMQKCKELTDYEKGWSFFREKIPYQWFRDGSTWGAGYRDWWFHSGRFKRERNRYRRKTFSKEVLKAFKKEQREEAKNGYRRKEYW